MGYTHYWRQSRDFTADEWQKITADAAKIVASAPVCFEDDQADKPAQVDHVAIRFNGIGDDGCETFELCCAAHSFEFCKTRQRPYDTAVCAVLAIAAEAAPDAIRVSSDGGDRDWRGPLDWGAGILGRPLPLPLRRGEDD